MVNEQSEYSEEKVREKMKEKSEHLCKLNGNIFTKKTVKDIIKIYESQIKFWQKRAKRLEIMLIKKRYNMKHNCNCCGIPIFLYKKGDNLCYGCGALFKMTHEEVMQGCYQTRFTAGIHRQALGFAYSHCLEEREKANKHE